jgi:hypothetical protein
VDIFIRPEKGPGLEIQNRVSVFFQRVLGKGLEYGLESSSKGRCSLKIFKSMKVRQGLPALFKRGGPWAGFISRFNGKLGSGIISTALTKKRDLYT